MYEASQTLGLPFYVLSGEYGLVPPERPIPDYDHPLSAQEVPQMAEIVADQIRASEITALVYFTRPLAGNPNVLPYHDTLASACSSSLTSLLVVELEDKHMSSWRSVMQAADTAKLAMISDRSAGELEFSALIASNPNDGMIYFKRGEASEALGENALAAADYRRAMAMFPMPEWKARAKAALERVT